jgi:hypothetical protein
MSKKTDLVKEALIDLKEIHNFIKENSENMVKPMLEGSVQKGLKKLIFEADYDEETADDTEKDNIEGVEDTESTEVEPAETEIEPEVETEPEVEIPAGEEETTDVEPEIGGDEVEGAEGEDFDFSQFDQSEEGEYDLTNADTDQLIKVFKLVSGNDQVVIDDLGDGKIQLKDNETGSEYLITTQGSAEPEVDVELDNDPVVSEGKQECYESNGFDADPELEIELGPDQEGEGMVDEKNMTQSYGVNRRAGVLSQTRAEYAPGANKRNGGTLVGEGKKLTAMKNYYEKKLKEMTEGHNNFKKTINEENTKLKETLGLFRDKLKENAVVNNSLGKFVKLVIENSTTDVEKAQIFARFVNEAKTIEDGNKLFESIKKELNGKPSNNMITEKQFAAENSKVINEQVVYEDKNLSNIKSLMARVDKALA